VTISSPAAESASSLHVANLLHTTDIATGPARAHSLPEGNLTRRRTMDTFFVRKQIVVGAVVFGVIQLAVLLVRAMAH
jgi:hypothetical protein